MNRLCLLAFTAIVGASQQTIAAEKMLKVINRRDAFAIAFVYITPAGRSNWGKDQLGGEVIAAGESHSWTIPWDGCNVDVKAQTFTGLSVERMDVNVCGGTEWTIYDDHPNSTPQPARLPTANFEGRMTWRITDKCANTESIKFRFFSENGAWQWPGGTEFWYTRNFGESYDQELTCPAGHKICYGAWQPSHNLTWGAGANGTNSCSHCCYVCDGDVHPMTLTCG